MLVNKKLLLKRRSKVLRIEKIRYYTYFLSLILYSYQIWFKVDIIDKLKIMEEATDLLKFIRNDFKNEKNLFELKKQRK